MTREYSDEVLRLTGGRWMRDTWGVVAWVQIDEPAPDPEHVCTCAAKAWEPCMTPDGKRTSKQHKGRTRPRECRCGAIPHSRSARMCQDCADEEQRLHGRAWQRNKKGAA